MIILAYLIGMVLNFYLLTFFIKIAKNKQIIAVGNSKNLHKGKIPRGAGIVFGFIYLSLISISFIENYIMVDYFFLITFGSVSCLILGFLDDVYDLKVYIKFIFQFLIILCLTFYFYDYFIFDNKLFNILSAIFMIFFSIWILNAYNFMDGSDGHLATVSSIQCVFLMLVLYINDKNEMIPPIFLLLSSLIVFLKFNLPPAKVFMGDSGSLFIGINFIIFTFIILKLSMIKLSLIIIIFSYYLIDCLGTLILRIYLNQSWKSRHRSHPYQNFSRIYSHNRMLKYVVIFHFIWLLPLLILANKFSSFEIIFSLISLIPSIIFLIKYGPMYSSH